MIEVLNAAVSTIAAYRRAGAVVQSPDAPPRSQGSRCWWLKTALAPERWAAVRWRAWLLTQQPAPSEGSRRDWCSTKLRYLHHRMACQGGGVVHRVPVWPEVCIYGAGHGPGELAAFASVFLIDDRPELVAEQRPRHATYGDMAEFARTRAGGPDKYVAIVTRGHAFDEQVLREVLRQDPLPHYIGMMGSVHKVRACFESLRAAGYTEDLITRVRAPIGLPIGGDTPKEIAVSIVSEMISFRYGRSVPRHQGSATV